MPLMFKTFTCGCVFWSADGRHNISYCTLNRGSEVRQLQPCNMSVVHYPTAITPGVSVFKDRGGGSSMSCLAFTNTCGKSNPGDRVDMDVSHALSAQHFLQTCQTRHGCFACMPN